MADIKITADSSQAQGAISALETKMKSLERSMGGIDKASQTMVRSLGAVAGALVAGSLFNFVDGIQNMTNKLRVASGSSEDFAKNMAYVRQIADSTGQSLQATGDLYSKVALNAEKLGYNTEQVAATTNAFALALKVSGASAQGSASSIYQFGQILAKGKVNGDEFTTIMENLGGPVMDAVAKNMGVTTAELIRLKEKGLIGAKDFTDALIKSMDELNTMGGKIGPTLGQSLTKVQNSFATLLINLEKSTGVFDKLGNGLTFLANNADKVATIFATMMGFLIGAKIAAAIVGIYKLVTAVRALGIAGAVAEALLTGGISAVGALAGATAAFAGASLIFDKLDKDIEGAAGSTKSLADAAKEAAAGLGETAGQMTGVADKYQQITRELNAQLAVAGANPQQLEVENKLLTYKRDLQFQMTAAQESELRGLLQKIELTKQSAKITLDLAMMAREQASLNIQDIAQRRIATELDAKRKEYGEAAFNARRGELEAAIKTSVYNEAERSIKLELKTLADDAYLLTINDLRAREIKQQLLIKERELGSAFTKELSAQYEAQLKINQALRDNETIQRNIAAYRTPQTGIMAATTVSGMLGQLDPVKQAQTQAETVFNGLEELRAQNKISEDEYRTMRVAAEVQANQQILDATRQRFETQKLLELQSQKNSIFGYETQRAMAQEAAAFEMKTTFERSQFAIQQGAAVFAALGAQNRKAFEASKALNIAMAIMNTYAGATKALATYPFPFGLIAAAAAVAAGMAQVAAIRSQSYSGRAVGGPVVGGQSYMVGEKGPEVFTPSTAGSITKNSDLQGGAPVNVNFTIYANDTSGFDELLTSRRGTIQTIISDAMLERGQR